MHYKVFYTVQDWIDAGMSWNSLICGDCMDALAAMPKNFCELAIVDPPYGIKINRQMTNPNINKRWKKHVFKNWDDEKPEPEFFNELFRISENQIIWGGNYFHLPLVRGWIVWDKIQKFTTGEFEMAWNSKDMPTKAFRYSRCQAYTGVEKIHPTQKPVELYRWLMQNYAKPGDKILDTHLGSGSNAIATFREGHKFIGIEKDREYFDAMVKLVERETKQIDLFESEKSGQPVVENLDLFDVAD